MIDKPYGSLVTDRVRYSREAIVTDRVTYGRGALVTDRVMFLICSLLF